MITSTNLNALRNLEHFQVMSNVLSYLKEENLEELKLSAFAESFEKQLKVYDEVLVLERGNVLSLKLTDADKKRDDAYRALAGIVKAYTVFPEEEKADAALKLLHVIGIDRLPYLQESGVLANLLQDLELAENKALLSLLHLDEWLMKLKEACTEFDSLFLNRESDNSTKLSGQVKTVRQGIQELFQNLANLIQAYEIVYGADAYTALSAKINEAVDYARTQAARRGLKGKGEEKTVTE